MRKQWVTTTLETESLLVTKKEAARELRLSLRQIDYLIQQGKLTKVKIGKASRVTRTSVRDLAGQPAAEAAE